MNITDQIYNGLLLKNQLINKIEYISINFLKQFKQEDFKKFEKLSHRSEKKSWSSPILIYFYFADWELMMSEYGAMPELRLNKYNFLAKRDMEQDNYNTRTFRVMSIPDTLSDLIALDKSFNDFFSEIGKKIPEIQYWIDDLILSIK